jgi:hypothetical protein
VEITRLKAALLTLTGWLYQGQTLSIQELDYMDILLGLERANNGKKKD